MENISFAYQLISPYVFNQAKTNIQDLEYYFNTNIDTSGNKLIEEIVSAIKTYDLDSFSDPLFQTIINKCGYSGIEAQKIFGEFKKAQTYTDAQVKPAREYIKQIVASSVLRKASNIYGDDYDGIVKYIKNSGYQSIDNDCFGSTNFDDFDIQAIMAQQSLGAIKTNYQWLNDAFPPHNGIERGQLGIISAPPGVGKSLFAMNLALCFASQGVKVLYVTLGDLVEKDWIVRLGAILSGGTFSDVYSHLPEAFQTLKTFTKGNLEVSINPSGKVEATDIVDYALSKDFEVIFVDYDANHKGAADGTENSGSSMYSSIGKIYSEYTRLTMAGRLVLMCSQPKIYSWSGQLIGLPDIGESKRKQETADFIITISNTAPDCPNHLYTAYIPKARRGRVGTKKYLIRIEGRFIEIPKTLYQQLSQVTEEVNYTEQQINRMSAEFRKQESQIQAQIQNGGKPTPSQHPPLAAQLNPFTP